MADRQSMDQLDLNINTPRERVLELLAAQRGRNDRYPFLTLRSLKHHLDIQGDELRSVIEPMEVCGEITVGIINRCNADTDGDGCASRAHFVDRKNIPDTLVECVGCGEIFHTGDMLETWVDPFSGQLAEITIHLPGDVDADMNRKVRHYNVIDS